MKKKQPTLRDVAELAGVSVGTVSKYLKDPYSLKDRNRIVVGEAIETLNYTPSSIARQLATGDTNNILLYIADDYVISESTWLHQLPVIQSLGDSLRGTDYDLQMKIGSAHTPRMMQAYIEDSINSRKIDAVAVLSAWEVPRAVVEMLENSNIPYILIDNFSPYVDSNQIYVDNHSIGKALTKHLIRLGHRDIGFINVEAAQQHMKMRLKGYRDALENEGIPFDEKLIFTGDFSIESGYKCAKYILKNNSHCTAIIAGNDNMAAGLINGLKEGGVRVPEDISVFGMDNSLVSKATSPKLSTVSISADIMGRLAGVELLKSLKDKKYKPGKIVIPFKIVERQSVSGRA